MKQDRNDLRMNKVSVFVDAQDAVAAEAMRAVDDVLTQHFSEKYGLEIGTYGAKWAVRRTDVGLVNDELFPFTAYSYADCVKWILSRAESKTE